MVAAVSRSVLCPGLNAEGVRGEDSLPATGPEGKHTDTAARPKIILTSYYYYSLSSSYGRVVFSYMVF